MQPHSSSNFELDRTIEVDFTISVTPDREQHWSKRICCICFKIWTVNEMDMRYKYLKRERVRHNDWTEIVSNAKYLRHRFGLTDFKSESASGVVWRRWWTGYSRVQTLLWHYGRRVVLVYWLIRRAIQDKYIRKGHGAVEKSVMDATKTSCPLLDGDPSSINVFRKSVPVHDSHESCYASDQTTTGQETSRTGRVSPCWRLRSTDVTSILYHGSRSASILKWRDWVLRSGIDVQRDNHDSWSLVIYDTGSFIRTLDGFDDSKTIMSKRRRRKYSTRVNDSSSVENRAGLETKSLSVQRLR